MATHSRLPDVKSVPEIGIRCRLAIDDITMMLARYAVVLSSNTTSTYSIQRVSFLCRTVHRRRKGGPSFAWFVDVSKCRGVNWLWRHSSRCRCCCYHERDTLVGVKRSRWMMRRMCCRYPAGRTVLLSSVSACVPTRSSPAETELQEQTRHGPSLSHSLVALRRASFLHRAYWQHSVFQ